MKYLYHKNNGSFLMIKNINDNSIYPHIEISEEQEQEILLAKKSGKVIKVINNEYQIFINEVNKRTKLVKERNNYLLQTDAYMFEDVRTEKSLTAEDIEDLLEYRLRLREMPNHYDVSNDKQNWSYVFVDVYTSGKNTNSYQLFKPEFIK